MNNRKHNATNPYQGNFKKVLCVCSAGLLRSPTAAWVLSNPPFNFNTRAAGLEVDFALVPVDEVLLHWADEVVCMDFTQAELISRRYDGNIINLNIPDNYEYMNPELVDLIKDRYLERRYFPFNG